jgi:hypothetical protein
MKTSTPRESNPDSAVVEHYADSLYMFDMVIHVAPQSEKQTIRSAYCVAYDLK